MDIQEVLSAQKFKLTRALSDVNIVVIGCGGTGGKLIRDLCQAIAATKKLVPQINLQILLVDPDVVEAKNLDRQNFVECDVHQKKATVLGDRYSQAYSLPVMSTAKIVDSSEDLGSLITKVFDKEIPLSSDIDYNNYRCDNLIITCVDNHQTRKLVSEFFLTHSPVWWLDLGNEATTGQMCLGYNSINRNHFDYENETQFDLPCSTEIFPDILEVAGAIKPSELPCGSGGAQELNINAVMATTAMSWICSYFRGLVNLQGNLVVRDDKLTNISNYHSVSVGIDPPVKVPVLSTPTRLASTNWGSTIREKRNNYRYREFR